MDKHFPQIIRQWLGSQRNRGNEYIDMPTKEAAGICGRSQATSEAAKRTEPVNRKERASFNAAVKPLEENALQAWAQRKNLWIDEDDFMKQYASQQIGAGAEQRVYLHKNGREVIKANQVLIMVTGWSFSIACFVTLFFSRLQNIPQLDLQTLSKLSP